MIRMIDRYGVQTSTDFRARFQNKFWNMKLILWIALVALSFFIPNAFFIFVANYIFFPFATLFILIQIVILIDFAYTVSEYILGLWEETDDRRYLGLLLGITGKTQ